MDPNTNKPYWYIRYVSSENREIIEDKNISISLIANQIEIGDNLNNLNDKISLILMG